jgi:hypothetical protein
MARLFARQLDYFDSATLRYYPGLEIDDVDFEYNSKQMAEDY